MQKQGCVYILANTFHHLYIGVTSFLEQRIYEHKNGIFENSFTSRYKIDRLVYYETYDDIRTAIAREKQLKGWLRVRKIQLIVATNPTWKHLSEEWGKPVEFYKEPENRP